MFAVPLNLTKLKCILLKSKWYRNIKNVGFLFIGLQYKYELYVEDLLFATSMATKKKEAKNQVCIIAFRILSTWASQKIADQVIH